MLHSMDKINKYQHEFGTESLDSQRSMNIWQCSPRWEVGAPGGTKDPGLLFIVGTFVMERKFEKFYRYILLSLKKEKQGIKKDFPNI